MAKRWAIVLAGGDGRRMEDFIRRRLGRARPKQYCAFSGGRTMLEHTLDRARDVAAPERILTVINADHRPYLESPRRIEIPGRLVVQPERRDTGPGVFLPLTHVLARDPEALVAIMPSDHFIHPRETFRELLDRAFRLAEFLPGRLILLAARPDRPEPEYGWIEPGAALPGRGALTVARFTEKPGPAQAERLHRSGGLWSTMIMTARAAALWDVAGALRPDMIRRFEALRPWLGTPGEEDAVARAYRDMASVNFSHDILGPAAERAAVLPMDGVRWSDWGRPERLAATLAELAGRLRVPTPAELPGRA